jgi:hypothetical protein
MTPSQPDARIARQLWDYLRIGQPVRPAEWLLVFGGHDLAVADRAADLYHQGVAPRILASGGDRALPDDSAYATEADAIRDILIAKDVPKEAVVLERLASNTSENFWFSAELLRDQGVDPQRFLIVQKPYTERRVLATARRRWPGKNVRVTSQEVTFEQYCAGSIPVPKIFSMLAGEIVRLDSYAHSGLIQQEEPVPAELIEAAHHLQTAGYDARSLRA